MGFEVFLARINNRRKAYVTTADMHDNEDSCRIRGRCVIVHPVCLVAGMYGSDS